jgi:ribosomal protein S18 acetylase RimI-like enzyme
MVASAAGTVALAGEQPQVPAADDGTRPAARSPRGVSQPDSQGPQTEAVRPPLRLVRLPVEKPAAAVSFLQARSRGVMDLIAHFWERLAATPPLQRPDLHLVVAADESWDEHIKMPSGDGGRLTGAMLYVPKAHRADVLALDRVTALAFASYILQRGLEARNADAALRVNGDAGGSGAGGAAASGGGKVAQGVFERIPLLDLTIAGGGAGDVLGRGASPPPDARVPIDFLTGSAEGIDWMVPELLPAVHRKAPARRMVNVVMQLPDSVPCEASTGVRPARDADIPVLNRWRRAYKEERGILFDADLDAWVATGRVFVFEHDGQIVAVAKLDLELPSLVEIGGVYTFPDYRQRGFGSMMVSDLARRIRAMKKVPTLQVDEENGPALRLYQSSGWVPMGRLGRVWLTG